jgi:D-aminopeptidase
VTLRIEFVGSQMGDMASLLPGAVRLDGRTIEFESPDMPSAYQRFRAAVTLAG